MVEFTRVTDISSKEFEAAMDIYAGAFPVHEQQPLAVVKERVRLGLNQIYVGRIDDDIAFMALLWPLKNTDFILLDYMATGLAYRGKNIGSHFLGRMREVLAGSNKYFIVEAEDPEYGENKDERKRRVAFYKRNGAKVLKDVRYVLPALQGDASTEMVLMVFPEYKMNAGVVRTLIVQIYRSCMSGMRMRVCLGIGGWMIRGR